MKKSLNVSNILLLVLAVSLLNVKAWAFDSFEVFLSRPGNVTDNLLKVIHAAKQDNAESQYILARLLYIGYGVKRDKDNAEKWLDKAVDAKFSDAVYMKGLIILQNEENYNTESKYGESLLLTLADNDHHIESIKFLAHAYAIGDVLPLNPEKSNQLYHQLFKFKPREAINQAIESFATAIGLYRVNNDNLVEQYRQSLFLWHKKAIVFEEYKRCSSVAYAYQDKETQMAWRHFCKNAGQRDRQLSLELSDSQQLLTQEQQQMVLIKAKWLKNNIPNNYQNIPPT
jgi:tetratricopeptide (TPR) repeat protein